MFPYGAIVSIAVIVAVGKVFLRRDGEQIIKGTSVEKSLFKTLPH